MPETPTADALRGIVAELDALALHEIAGRLDDLAEIVQNLERDA